MYLCYYDESGDDGYPATSSDLFVLSAVYLRIGAWRSIYDEIADFRRGLRRRYGFPVKTEMHTRDFLLNKGIYSGFGYSDATRVNIVTEHCDLIGRLKVRIINVVIVKPRILFAGYKVLDKAVTFSLQRIDNDMNKQIESEKKVILITDEGRVGKMRKTIRRMQVINYIPSKFPGMPAYQKLVSCVVEDILQKESDQSYFIQLADLVTYVVRLYSIGATGIGSFPPRLPTSVTNTTAIDWMNRLAPSINLQACPANPYGVFFHPT